MPYTRAIDVGRLNRSPESSQGISSNRSKKILLVIVSLILKKFSSLYKSKSYKSLPNILKESLAPRTTSVFMEYPSTSEKGVNILAISI